MRRPRQASAALVTLLALACAALSAQASDQPPDWLREAAAQPTPEYASDVGAVVLLRDRTVEVKSGDRFRVSERGAIRVLHAEGREEAACAAVYLTDGGKVTDMLGWLLGPGERTRPFGKKEWVDARLNPDDVYDEARVRGLSAAAQAEPGTVFGYEWTTEMRTPFLQFDWAFQDALPVRLARLTVRVPAAWRTTGIVLNHEPITAQTFEDATAWELRDLPAVPDEPSSPPLSALVPRVAVSIVPDAPEHAGAAASFTSWTQVSDWLASLSDDLATPDEALRERAHELVDGRSTDLERIRAIGEYVQGLNYVSIQTGVGRGGGYRPHAPSLVLEKGYGDCKDKANLMRAMLAAVDVPAWLVSIYSGNPAFVREPWPSPQQFNHCIIAIRAPAGDSLATRFDHPALGPLIVFDPTDPWTPLGGLPESEQGSLALIVRRGEEDLTRMPVTAPAANAMRRTMRVKLDAGGRISADIHESSGGTAARDERSWRHGFNQADYRRAIENWVARGIAGAMVDRLAVQDDPVGGGFDLDLHVTAEHYGKRLSAGLQAICPMLVSRRDRFGFSGAERTQPIEFEAESNEVDVTIELPSSWEVEEFPEAIALDTDFATYRTSYTFHDGNVHFTRTLETRRTTLPPDRYAEVRAFLKSVRRGETALVLLHGGS